MLERTMVLKMVLYGGQTNNQSPDQKSVKRQSKKIYFRPCNQFNGSQDCSRGTPVKAIEPILVGERQIEKQQN